MSKSVFIAEKPSVAREFAKALHSDFKSADGYMESDKYVPQDILNTTDF